jgi:NADP-dependent 3-hydroxy acid dehydrogenase YdfG
MGSLTERVAVVAGASSGIGRAIAVELAAAGARVWLLARRAAALRDVAAEARERGGCAQPYALDLCSDDELAGFAAALRAQGGVLDVLIHSAGIHRLGAIAESPVAELDEQYRVNVRAPYALTQFLLPLLLPRRGQIVFINSSVGLQARAQVGAFAATQHALRALADALRDEVNGHGIRVLSVYPGRTATARQAAIHATEGKPYEPERLLQPADVAAVVLQALAAERTAEVTEIRLRPMQKPVYGAGS